jgi:putative ABC transport system ATP-binding protein
MTTNGDELIQLEGVMKVFYTDEMETHALADVHLDIRRGEYVSIEGPSGSGKTTLLSILGLLDSPTSGKYSIGGQPAAHLTPRERAELRNRQIGFIFQSFNLIGDLNVFENVEAASSSAWPWHAPSRETRWCCSPTSPPATSTRRTATR